MARRPRGIAVAALPMMIAVLVGACASGVQLPVLREATGFTLTDQDAREVRLSDLRGKIVLMDFFYASCPTVCPTMNRKLKAVRDGLDEETKQDLVLISVSFDAVVDTPEVLRQYASEQGFDVPGWRFLTGTERQVSELADSYGVGYELLEAVKDEADPAYDGPKMRFNHSVVFVLIDRDGMVRKTYGDLSSPDAEMIADITSLR